MGWCKMSSIHRIMMRVIASILIPPKSVELVKGAAMELRHVLPEKIQLRTERWPGTQQHAHRSQVIPLAAGHCLLARHGRTRTQACAPRSQQILLAGSQTTGLADRPAVIGRMISTATSMTGGSGSVTDRHGLWACPSLSLALYTSDSTPDDSLIAPTP